MQDPPDLILDFIKEWEKGYDVVVGIRRKIDDDFFIKEVLIKYFKDSNIEIIKYIIEYLELENMIIEYYKLVDYL